MPTFTFTEDHSTQLQRLLEAIENRRSLIEKLIAHPLDLTSPVAFDRRDVDLVRHHLLRMQEFIEEARKITG